MTIHTFIDEEYLGITDTAWDSLTILPTVQMLRINGTSDTYTEADKIKMSLVLAHEIGHTMGLPEMYNDPRYIEHLKDNDNENDSMFCIMCSYHIASAGASPLIH